MKKILCICLSSTLQRTVTFEKLLLAEVNRSKCYREDASGKAVNSARVLNQLEPGCVQALCPLGEENANAFLKLIQRDGLELAYVTIPGKTRECWTLLDKRSGTTTELVVGEGAVSKSEKDKIQNAEIKLLKYLNNLLPEVDAVLLAGSRPDCWSSDLYSTICGIVKDNKKVFLADFIGDDLRGCLEGAGGLASGMVGGREIGAAVPDIIKINDEEYCKTFGYHYPISERELKDSICKKSKEWGNMIVITRGVRSTFGAKAGVFAECGVEKVKAVNTTACGDSFNAGFLYEYLNSGDFEKAMKKGTWCAARNAEREAPGTLN